MVGNLFALMKKKILQFLHTLAKSSRTVRMIFVFSHFSYNLFTLGSIETEGKQSKFQQKTEKIKRGNRINLFILMK